MLKAKIRSYLGVRETIVKGDYLLIEDHLGNEWRIAWKHTEGDYIDVSAVGHNVTLEVHPRAANAIRIT